MTGRTWIVIAAVVTATTSSPMLARLTAQSVLFPHDIQGPGPQTPLDGQLVSVRGVVTGRTASGFFIQTEPGFEDADGWTSEGLFVRTAGSAPTDAHVGAVIVVDGTVAEFKPADDPDSPPRTELMDVTSINALSTSALPSPVVLTPTDVSPAGTLDQLERFEGMRVYVATLQAVRGTGGTRLDADAASQSDGTFFAVLSSEPRPFRSSGIAIDEPQLSCGAPTCSIPIFDGNPERLRVATGMIEGTTAVDLAAGALFSDVVGPLDFASRTYTVLTDSPIVPSGGATITAAPAPGADRVSVATLNLDRFFDATDDPGADVVLTAAALDRRLSKASLTIRNILNAPDVIGLQEVETLVVLQQLAARIDADAAAAGQPEPNYSAHLVDGSDPLGLDVAFLVKTAGGRVTAVAVDPIGTTDVFVNPDTLTTELVNDRPSLAGQFRFRGSATVSPQTVHVIVSQFRSLDSTGLDAPAGEAVRAQRRAQAESLATYIQGRQTANPSETLIALGGFNALRANDGYVDVVGTVIGTPAAPEAVALASTPIVFPALVNLEDGLDPAERYSVVKMGHAQSLDHIVVSANLMPQLPGFAIPRVNADFPDALRNDPLSPSRLSDRDPLVAYFDLRPDQEPPLLTVPANITATAPTSAGVTVTFAAGATDAVDPAPIVSCTPPSGSTFAAGTTTVSCTATDAAGNIASGSFTVTVNVATPPPSTDLPGRVFGSGEVRDATGRAWFMFDVRESARNVESGWVVLKIKDHRGRPDRYLAANVSNVAFSNVEGYGPGRRPRSGVDTVTFTGVGYFNGRSKHTFEITASDRGEPGRGRDTFSVIIKAPNGTIVESVSGTLRDGNIQSR